MNEFLNDSIKYIQETDIRDRKNLGQYFTPQGVVSEVFKYIPLINSKDLNILEPSYGTGEFLNQIEKIYSKANIDALELDQKLFNLTKNKFPKVNKICADALTYDYQKQYDLIVGNPPYFEFKLTPQQKNEYNDVVGGRVNIFNLFVKKSIDLLKPNGYLAFVIPPSMNNGAYFQKLRAYTISHCDIIHLSVLPSDLFHGAQQTVMILVLQKTVNTGKYVFAHEDKTIFSTNEHILNDCFKKKDTYSIKDLGYKVFTGPTVWNQHKELLSDDPNDTLLIWSHNIQDNKLVLNNKPKKKQYIKSTKSLVGPAIVVNRITGTVGSAALRIALIPAGKEFQAENHVNVIMADENNVQLKTINELFNKLKTMKKLPEIIQAITGNTQLSKTELEQLIPITF